MGPRLVLGAAFPNQVVTNSLLGAPVKKKINQQQQLTKKKKYASQTVRHSISSHDDSALQPVQTQWSKLQATDLQAGGKVDKTVKH